MELLRPILSEDAQGNVGKVVIGTVKGDLHNVGKDLVKLLMESKGIEVKDLGEDVAPETFVKAAKEEQANILAMSAMLTSTMPVMKEVIEMLKANDMQGSVKTMIGGAPVNKEFAAQIGADSYTDDALEAAEVALSYMA